MGSLLGLNAKSDASLGLADTDIFELDKIMVVLAAKQSGVPSGVSSVEGVSVEVTSATLQDWAAVGEL